MTAERFTISGKVQGVWFRAATCERALALGLRGHANNLADGTVEVLAAGDTAAVEALAQWLQHGPSGARVDTVLRAPADDDARVPTGFSIG